MSLAQRSYSGKCFRPKPLVGFDEQSQSTLVVTSWNSPEPANKVFQMLKDFLVTSSDPDATVAGPYIEGLGPTANRLRNAAILANENLFLNENRTEYVAGVELAVFSVHKDILSWVQIGAPHLILSSAQGFQPLCYTPDGAWQMQQDTPLLSHGLGIEKSVYFNCGNYRLQGEEQLVMISRSQIPSNLYANNIHKKANQIDILSQVLVEDRPETPFWIGISNLTGTLST